MLENEKAKEAFQLWRERVYDELGHVPDTRLTVFTAGYEAATAAMMNPAEARFLANDSIVREADRFRQTCQKLSEEIAKLRGLVDRIAPAPGLDIAPLDPAPIALPFNNGDLQDREVMHAEDN